jgi:pimeloyl-ACP methyl ester carboxylesterase
MRVPHDGIELNVEVDGPDDGPPVTFVHGVSNSLRTYGCLPPEITAGRRILRIDLRGHGESGHAPGTYVLERYGADVAEVLRIVADRQAVLVGHSLGGNAAWWVAQHHPEMLAAAFLEDPPLYMGEPAEHERNPAAKMAPAIRDHAIAMREEGLSVEEASKRLAAAPLPSGVTAGDLVPEAIRGRAWAHLVLDPEVLTGVADRTTLAGTDVESPVGVPVLILAAGVRPAFTLEHEQRLAVTHPDVEVIRVAGAGHAIHDEIVHRTDYVEHLAAFLRRHAPV